MDKSLSINWIELNQTQIKSKTSHEFESEFKFNIERRFSSPARWSFKHVQTHTHTQQAAHHWFILPNRNSPTNSAHTVTHSDSKTEAKLKGTRENQKVSRNNQNQFLFYFISFTLLHFTLIRATKNYSSSFPFILHPSIRHHTLSVYVCVCGNQTVATSSDCLIN